MASATLDDLRTPLLGTTAKLLLVVAGCSLVVLWYHLYRTPRSWPPATKLPLPPGPRNWPLVGAIFSLPRGVLPYVAFTRLAKQYGPILHLRMGTTPFLIVSDAHSAKQVLKEQDAEFASRPYTTSGDVFGLVGIVVTPYGPEWRHRRRIVNQHLMCQEAFHSFHGVRDSEVGECLLEVVEAFRAGKPVSMQHLLDTLTTNMVTRITLSKSYFGRNAAQAEARQMALFKTATEESVRLFAKLNVGDIVPALRRWDIGGFRRAFLSFRARQDQWLDLVLAEREGKQRAVPDFLDKLLGLKQQGLFSDATVRAIVYEMLAAGTETAATSIHWAFSELLRNPAVMKRAREELDAVVGRARRVQESDIPNLPFLRAVVKETWRLHPPVPLCIPHHNPEEVKLLGFRVPAKSTVLINMYAIGRDPESWPDRTTEFVPDRFLHPRHSHIEGLGQDFELLPFSSGRRKCPGTQLGFVTVHLTLASLVHAFDWAPPEGMLPADIDMSEKSGTVLNRAASCIAVPAACRLHPSAYDL